MITSILKKHIVTILIFTNTPMLAQDPWACFSLSGNGSSLDASSPASENGVLNDRAGHRTSTVAAGRFARTVAGCSPWANYAASAPAPARWEWYPVNANDTSGLYFFFENAQEATVTVTVSGTRGAEPFSVTGTIYTDVRQGNPLLRFEVRNLDTLKVGRICIQMGKAVQTDENPKAGTWREF